MLGLQYVVDNRKLDDHLRKEGLEVGSTAVTKPQGYQRRCMAGSCALREQKGGAAMVGKIVRRA